MGFLRHKEKRIFQDEESQEGPRLKNDHWVR